MRICEGNYLDQRRRWLNDMERAEKRLPEKMRFSERSDEWTLWRTIKLRPCLTQRQSNRSCGVVPLQRHFTSLQQRHSEATSVCNGV
jgi:hypothetical protein